MGDVSSTSIRHVPVAQSEPLEQLGHGALDGARVEERRT